MISPYIYPGLKLDVQSEDIISKCCEAFGVKKSRMAKPYRHRETCNARFLAMTLLRIKKRKTLKQIGIMLGGRDHTTILYGIRKVVDLLEADADFLEKARPVLSFYDLEVEAIGKIVNRL